MKKNYTLTFCAIFLFAFGMLCEAQVRIIRVNPSTNTVVLQNFGSSNEPIGGLWFCNFPAYGQVSGMTSTSNLGPGAQVTITSSVNFAEGDGEFGLYTSSAFSSPAAMIDYMQWGSAGHGREGVAQSAGVWTAGTFINVAPPFEFIGSGNDFGVNFWQTSLSINDAELGAGFALSPNPASDYLNATFKSNLSEGQIDIYDISGKLIYQKSISNTNSERIDISNWNQGIYLITVNTNESSQTKRFVKQ